MIEGDPGSGKAPHDPARLPPPLPPRSLPSPPGPQRTIGPQRTLEPGFHPGVTAICTVLLLAGSIALVAWSADPLANLEDPARAVLHLFERSLDLEEGASGAAIADLLDEPGEPADEAIAAWRETIAHLAGPGGHPHEADRVRAHLVVLLCERGRIGEAEALLRSLETSTLPGAREFVRAARAAYLGVEAPEARLPPDLPGEGWARRHLRARLRGEAPQPASGRIAADRAIWTTWALVILLGLLCTAVLAFVPAARGAPASGLLPAPWSPGDGYAVLVRGPLYGFLLLVAVGAVALGFTGDLAAFPFNQASLLLFLPFVILIQRSLLRPRDLRFPQTFGLRLSARRSVWILGGVGLATLAVDQAGSIAVSYGCAALGLEGHWADGAIEGMFFSSTPNAVLMSLDMVIWAPLFEEIVFRGVLYATLRTRMKPLPAALLSAVLFSAVHLYSWPGFFVILWSGFVWAWAYEASRSLWPSILAHSLHNLVLAVHILVVYR